MPPELGHALVEHPDALAKLREQGRVVGRSRLLHDSATLADEARHCECEP